MWLQHLFRRGTKLVRAVSTFLTPSVRFGGGGAGTSLKNARIAEQAIADKINEHWKMADKDRQRGP